MRLEGMVLSKGAVAGHPNPLTVCCGLLYQRKAVGEVEQEGSRHLHTLLLPSLTC